MPSPDTPIRRPKLPARPLLQAPVDPELFAAARAAAKAKGLDLAKLVREAVRRYLSEHIEGAAPLTPVRRGSRLVEPDPARTTDTRFKVRLPEYVADAARDRATAAGMKTVSRWIAALAQSNVSTTPVLAEAEIDALHMNARALDAIGRNINQIAHSLNEARMQNEFMTRDRIAILLPTLIGQLDDFRKQIIETRVNIRALVRASRNAWDSE